MNQKEEISDEIKEKLDNIVFDEVKYGIITALQLYDALNLKKLAQLVGRPETTTIRYVKSLLSDDLIDVDAKKTAASWGKFYRLSQGAKIVTDEKREEIIKREKNIFSQLIALKDKPEEEVRKLLVKDILAKEYPEKLIASVNHSLALKHNIESTIANEFISSITELNRLIVEKGKEHLENNLVVEPSDIIMYGSSIKLTKAKQLLKIYELFIKFQNELETLGKEFEKEMKEENIAEEQKRTMIFQFFLGTMDFKFHLKNSE